MVALQRKRCTSWDENAAATTVAVVVMVAGGRIAPPLTACEMHSIASSGKKLGLHTS